MLIDILCKVVDNYGDIGVVYRLARALSEADPGIRLRLVVDDLGAFHALDPAVDPAKDVQEIHGWTVVRWSAPWGGFRAEPPRLVLECFACGRPDWLESIIFDPADSAARLIVNLEHLSAESYAGELHRMDSLTRSPLVKKRIFMPGFTAETGGLILDARFKAARGRFLDAQSRVSGRRALAEAWRAAGGGSGSPARAESTAGLFWVSVFGYERDWSRIVADLAAFSADRPILAIAAAGRSQAGFLGAWERAGKPFPAVALPFLPQEEWDEVLLAGDFAIVRGEDSLARAALSGRPFLWHAYVQDGGHQLVKVAALLERMRPLFPATAFASLERLFLAFNDRLDDGPGQGGEESLLPLLKVHREMEAGFRAFSEELTALGDLGAHLLTFLRDFV